MTNRNKWALAGIVGTACVLAIFGFKLKFKWVYLPTGTPIPIFYPSEDA